MNLEGRKPMQFRGVMRSALILVLSAAVCAACATTKDAKTKNAPPPGAKASGKSIPLTYTFSEDANKELGYLGTQYCQATTRPAKKLVAQPEYYSKRPMYGVFQFGTEKNAKLIMVLDESKGTRTGYDTLYVDVNGNLDLTDDAKLSAKPSENEENRHFAFPLVELKVKYGEKELPYHVKIETYNYGNVDFRVNTACYTKGDISLGGKKYAAAFLDGTGNGLFNDLFVTPKGMGGNQLYAKGDGLVIDLNNDSKFDRDNGQGSEAFPLGKYLSWGKKCYEITPDPTGRSYTLVKSKAKCGTVTLETQESSAILLSPDGALRVMGKSTVVPEGSYRFYACSLEAKDGEGQLWRAIGNGQIKQPPVVVTAKKATPLAVGAPLTAEVTVNKSESGVFGMSLAITGKGGESYTANNFQKVGKDNENMQSRPNPKVKIVDKDGKEVATGDFEYG